MMPIAVQPNQRLQQRSRESRGERNQTDLPEIQMKRIAQKRINRRQQRLHRIIQQMAKTNSQQNLKNSFRSSITGAIGNKSANFAFARHSSEPTSDNNFNPHGAKSTTKVYRIIAPARFLRGGASGGHRAKIAGF